MEPFGAINGPYLSFGICYLKTSFWCKMAWHFDNTIVNNSCVMNGVMCRLA